ncbi:MAG TPA: enolase C-terminal domain-like protein [Burkholderiales bacterium]|nr:enolase C-terminal domain-like protein [Burkholderiales bacterium]
MRPAAPRFRVLALDLLERDVVLRMPFRFGVVTLTAAPQAFARARIRTEDGREAEGGAAELLAPKWFDKDPALSNADNFEQLRRSLAQAREAYLAHEARSAWEHASPARGLVENFGPALLDRALLDALCRAIGASFPDAIRANLVGAPKTEGIDLGAWFATLAPAARIAARHTVGLVDPITSSDVRERVGDGLPETLEEVVSRYGHRYFKLKVGGDARADVERLGAIAAVLDRLPEYRVTLDGNEQYEDMQGVAELWARMKGEARLSRLMEAILFIEQPVKRQKALSAPVAGLARPVIIDESDDALDAFPRARALGYRGVSSKTCKGLYKSLLNGARCAAWNAQMGTVPIYFMSGEDLTIQAGLALQQDLALVSLLGLTHVERNGHHYVNGMAGLPAAEQAAFLAGHPDLYERSHGAARLRIAGGEIAIGSLGCAGYASRALPDWTAMREMTWASVS